MYVCLVCLLLFVYRDCLCSATTSAASLEMIGSLLKVVSTNVLTAMVRCWAYCAWAAKSNQQNSAVKKCTSEKKMSNLIIWSKESSEREKDKLNYLNHTVAKYMLEPQNGLSHCKKHNWTTRSPVFHSNSTYQWILWREMKSISVQMTSAPHFFPIYSRSTYHGDTFSKNAMNNCLLSLIWFQIKNSTIF